MNDPYTDLEHIWARYLNGERSNTETDILAVLHSQGIKPRQDDGELKQLTVSKPTSVESGFLIGLRYIKRDGTPTKTMFLSRKANPSWDTIEGVLKTSGQSIAALISNQ